MSIKDTHEVTEPESVNSTFTVVSAPPETMTPTHHSLEPEFNPTLIVSPVGVPGLEVGAGVVVGAGVFTGLSVGATGGVCVGAPVVVGAGVVGVEGPEVEAVLGT